MTTMGNNTTDRYCSRRSVLLGGAMGAVALATAPLLSSVATMPPTDAVRVLHMTDWHLMRHLNERGSERGLQEALRQALAWQPQALLDTGDLMTHTISRPLADVQPDMQYVEELFASVPGHIQQIHAIGNHDIWGWDRVNSGATGDEAFYGKKWWASRFGGGRTYGSTKLDAWQVIWLDSIQQAEDGYNAALDDEQFRWLERELQRISDSTPILILTHAPILGIGTLLSDAAIDPQQGWHLGRGHILSDASRVIELLSKHPNVRLALSGHKHICDRIEFQGMTHICDGAVCGCWWQPSSPRLDVKASIVRPAFATMGFGVIDLYRDGRFDHQYVNIAWNYVT